MNGGKKGYRKHVVIVFLLTLLMLTAGITAYAGTWQHDGVGWTYLQDNGKYAVDNGYIIDGKSYGFDAAGHMLANAWSQAKSGGHWVYYGADGAKVTNAWIDGKYYVGANGWMLTNTKTPDGYSVGADGAWDGKPAELPKAPKKTESQAASDSSSNTKKTTGNQSAQKTNSASDDDDLPASRNTITATIDGETDTYYVAKTKMVSGHYHFYAYSLNSDGSLGKKLHIGFLTIEQPGNVRPSDLTLWYQRAKGETLYNNTPSTVCKLTSGGKHIMGTISGTIKARDDSSTITVESASFDLYYGEVVEKVEQLAQEAGEFDGDDPRLTPDTSSSGRDNTCGFCHGSGLCNSCAGRGSKQNRYDRSYYDCALCSGTGRCAYCNGLGRRR